MYKHGDYVVYKNEEIGRVTEERSDGCFVCYTCGCTAAFTGFEYLRPATEEEIQKADPGIGFNRFKDECSHYVPDYCHSFCPDKINWRIHGELCY